MSLLGSNVESKKYFRLLMSLPPSLSLYDEAHLILDQRRVSKFCAFEALNRNINESVTHPQIEEMSLKSALHPKRVD